MPQAEPIQHHCSRQDHRQRVRDPLPRDVRRRTVAGLEHRVIETDVRRRRHAQPAHEPRTEIGPSAPPPLPRGEFTDLRFPFWLLALFLLGMERWLVRAGPRGFREGSA